MTPANPDPRTPSRAAGEHEPSGAHALGLRQYLWIAGAALVLAALLNWLGPILTPFLIGAVFAYLGSPAVNWAERHRVPRTLGTLAAIVLILLLFVALLLVFVPLVQTEFGEIVRRLPELAGQLYGQVAPWLKERFGIELQFDLATIKSFVTENMESAKTVAAHVLSGVMAGGTVLVSVLINLALIPVVMFYLLRDWNAIVDRLDELLPRRWLGRVRSISAEIDRVLAEFVRGQLSVMGVLALYYVAGLSLVGLHSAVSIGILTGLLVFIPYVGFGLGLTLGVLAALLQWSGWPGFIGVLVVYGIGQLLENYVLVPWLVGDRIGLHPLAVIFALLAFGQLFGFAGVLIALPASAALLVGLRYLRGAYLGSDLYR
jgi:predicted PurR-regulated permease PerM